MSAPRARLDRNHVVLLLEQRLVRGRQILVVQIGRRRHHPTRTGAIGSRPRRRRRRPRRRPRRRQLDVLELGRIAVAALTVRPTPDAVERRRIRLPVVFALAAHVHAQHADHGQQQRRDGADGDVRAADRILHDQRHLFQALGLVRTVQRRTVDDAVVLEVARNTPAGRALRLIDARAACDSVRVRVCAWNSELGFNCCCCAGGDLFVYTRVCMPQPDRAN